MSRGYDPPSEELSAMTPALLSLALLGQDPAATPRPRPVVVSTDIGAEVDDQWALAHLALSPAVELKGVVTTHAPSLPEPAADSAARVARELLDLLPIKDKP